MQTLTSQLVAEIFQVPQALADEVSPQLFASMQAFGITSSASITCYLVQCQAESGGLQYFAELGPESYFMHYDPQGDDPSLAANLGNIYPGDGYAFRGSGPIQVTGRGNFTAAQAAMQSMGLKGPDGSPLDITTLPSTDTHGPDLVRTHQYGFTIAAWWWEAHGGNTVAQRQPLSYASECCGRLVNEGDPDSSGTPQGEQNRLDAFAHISQFGDLALPSVAPPAPPAPPVLTLLEELMADSAAEAAFAQKVASLVVTQLLATTGQRNAPVVDPHTGKQTGEKIVSVTLRETWFGGATTTSVRMAAALNYIKDQAARIK